MATEEKLKSAARRSFFKSAGSGAAGAAVFGLTAGTAAAAEPRSDDRTAGSYRETDHVKAAYRTARF